MCVYRRVAACVRARMCARACVCTRACVYIYTHMRLCLDVFVIMYANKYLLLIYLFVFLFTMDFDKLNFTRVLQRKEIQEKCVF